MLKPRSDFGWLLLRLGPSRWRIALGLLCVSVAGVAVTIDPLLMRSLIDRALPQHNLHLALELVGGIGLCYFGRSALYGIGSLVNFSISQQCVRDLRAALLDQMNRLSADYHEQTPTGEKLTRLEHDVDEIANLGADTANQSVRAVLFFALNLAMMAKLSVPMTLTVLPLFPLFAIVQRRFSRMLKSHAEVGSASSHAPAEQALLSAVALFHPGQTLVIISHRIGSLAWVDRFVLLDQGRIAGIGNHSEMFGQSPLYRTLADASGRDVTIL